MNRPRFWFLFGLTAFAAASRLLPHPENFAPIAALALFGAATFEGGRSAVLVPLLALLLSDALMQVAYTAGWQHRPGFYEGQWVVYGCILATVGIGLLVRRKRNPATIAAATLAGSVVFFVVTNFVYFYGSTSIYPRTLGGLVECYTMAIPFFRNTLMGDVFYSAVLFGTFALAEATFPLFRASTAGPRESASA